MVCPFSSTAGVIWYVAMTDATVMNSVCALNHLPGQILCWPKHHVSTVCHQHVNLMHTLPKPCVATLGSRIFSFNFPFSMKRSGLNWCGSGYAIGSCKIALRLISEDVYEITFSYHEFAKMMLPFGIKYPSYSSSATDACAIAEHFCQ
jgi:hypothetical protein